MKDVDLAGKDLYPLVYSSRAMLRKKKDVEYNKCGFGAAGLPPLTFSHLSRNWRNIQRPKKPGSHGNISQEIGMLYTGRMS